MMWNGETLKQRIERQVVGFRQYAYLPTQMSCGTWVWFEYYWCALHRGPNMRQWYVSALRHADCLQQPPERPPSPKPQKNSGPTLA